MINMQVVSSANAYKFLLNLVKYFSASAFPVGLLFTSRVYPVVL